MFQRSWLVVLLVLSRNICFADCKCAQSQFVTDRRPKTVFTFSNNNRVVVCGIKEVDEGHNIATYSEFVMSECGVDTSIRSGTATEDCIIHLENDTLYVLQLDLMAVGRGFTVVRTPWLNERYYYQYGKLVLRRSLNPDLRYTQDQIKATIRQYQRTKWKMQGEGSTRNDEKMMRLANQLMIASISGSKTAEKYFYEFGQKFRPDGYYAEWYNDMAGIIQFAQNGDTGE